MSSIVPVSYRALYKSFIEEYLYEDEGRETGDRRIAHHASRITPRRLAAAFQPSTSHELSPDSGIFRGTSTLFVIVVSSCSLVIFP